MKIFPAIDIKDGKVVRLTEGDYSKVTVYADNPEDTAKSFIDNGAEYLHIVDLDGAKSGSPENKRVIEKIAGVGNLFIEVGGGIRTMQRIEEYVNIGVKRTILGTIAVKDYSFVEEAVRKYGEVIAVGVDARESKVAVNGWQEITQVDSVSFCGKLRDSGVKTVIYTDISKDGVLQGTNLEIYKKLSLIDGLDVIASGGITFEEEIEQLRDMKVYGAIVGKAIYAGKLDLKRVINIAKGTESI